MKNSFNSIIAVTFLSMLLCLILLQRCSNENCHVDENSIVESFNFLTIDTQYAWVQNVNPNKTTVNLVIENQQDYEKYVGISGDILRPKIDFSEFILLAGRIFTPQCSFVSKQVVLDKCGVYTFEVMIELRDCHAFTTSNYFVIIHKTEHPISFEIIN